MRIKMPKGAQMGFSLVEIMLALAVIAIGLVAVIGLIPQGIQASRDAADNTLAATIAHDTFNQMRQQSLIPAGTWPPVSQTVYYDALATNVINAVTDPQDAYFRVVVTPQLSVSVQGLYVVTASVTWPAKPTTVSPLNTNIFVTTIANYQH
jgi:uncharacterized protein (TIGR02598 family)